MKRTATLVFGAGVAAYLVLHVAFLQYPVLRHRQLPIEPDDAYSYILKAPQLLECRGGACPALTDLRPQLQAPSSDNHVGGTGWIRGRQFLRLFVSYHPLHTILLLLLHQVGMTWESAYNGIWLTGSVFIGLAVARWLHAMVGPGGAGIAMGALAFGHFQEQGLDSIVPSTLSMAIALLAWAIILVEKPKQDRWLPVLVALTVAMHSGGLLWSAITLSAYVLFRYQRSGHFYRVASSCVAAWLIGAWYVRHISVAAGGGGHLQNPLRRDPDALFELVQNGLTAARVASAWVLSFGGGASQLARHLSTPQVALLGAGIGTFLGALCLMGLRSLDPRRRQGIVIQGLLITTVTVASVFYVIPGHPAPLFVRSWVFVALLCAGLAGQGVWVVAARLATRQARSLMIAAASVAVVVAASLRISWGLASLEVLRDSMAERADFTFDQNQPRLLEQQGASGSAVLYLAETPLYFYLAHGGNRFPAVYFPAVADTPLQARWIQANAALRFVVGMGPAAGLTLGMGDSLTVTSPPAAARTLRLLLAATRGPIVLEWWPAEDGRVLTRQSLNLDQPAWITLPVLPALTLRIQGASSAGIRIGGLKYDVSDASHWPWGLGTELSVTKAGVEKARSIRFDLDREIPIPHRGATILSDQGDTFLASLNGGD